MQQPDRFSVIVVSSDAAFRDELRQRLGTVPFLSVAAEITGPFSQLAAGRWEELRLAGPGYLMVDLDPARGEALRLIAEVAESKPELKIMAYSREVSTETLLEALRSGAAEFIHKPVDEKVLMDALLRIRRQFVPRAAAQARSAGQVLTFFSTKGGSGATTVACNAAVSLARGKKSVLLVDLDLQLGELALFLGLKPKYTILDLLSNLHRADEALLKTFVVKHESGVHLLAGPDAPETEAVVGGEQIRKAIQFLRAHYDFIVIDMPNNYYDYVVATLDQANQMFLVCTADLPSLKNIQRSLAIFEKLGFGKSRMHVVLNRFEKSEQGIDRAAVERIVGGKVFWSIPNDYPTVIRAINSGVPLASTNHTEIARSFRGFADLIEGVDAAAGKGPEKGTEKGPKLPFRFLKK
jgi:pilus assembly protein CpaE